MEIIEVKQQTVDATPFIFTHKGDQKLFYLAIALIMCPGLLFIAFV